MADYTGYKIYTNAEGENISVNINGDNYAGTNAGNTFP